MKRIWAEFTCDNCGTAEQFLHPYSNAVAKSMGWIIVSKDEHYCTEECFKQAKGNFYEKV